MRSLVCCFENGWQVSFTVLLKCLLCFPTWNIVTCILCMDFAMAVHVLLFKNTKGVFPIEGFRLEVYLREFTRNSMILVLFRVFLCSLKGRWYKRLTHERTFFRWFREVHVSPPVEWPLASAYRVCRCGERYMRKISILTMIKGYKSGTRRPCSAYGFVQLDKSSSRIVKLLCGTV